MKTTTSAKALDFTRHTHPGHKGRGFHPKTQKSGQRSMYPLFPPKSWCTEKIDSRSELLLIQFRKPSCEKSPLWFLLGKGQCLLIRRTSLICPAEPAVHIRTGGMRQVIIRQFAMFEHRVNMRQTGLWTIAHGNGNGTIELYDWRRLNL